MAADVKLPAVVDAHQRAAGGYPVVHRHPLVRASLVDEAHAPLAVAERDKVLAEEPNAHGPAVVVRQVGGEQAGVPVAAQHAPHRRAGPGSADEFVVFLCEHDRLPRLDGRSIAEAAHGGEVSLGGPCP